VGGEGEGSDGGAVDGRRQEASEEEQLKEDFLLLRVHHQHEQCGRHGLVVAAPGLDGHDARGDGEAGKERRG